MKKDNAPQNFAVLRYIVVNLLGKEKSQKLGNKSKQFCAGWDDEYLGDVFIGIIKFRWRLKQR